MIDSIINKVKGFFLTPVETFQQVRDDEPSVVFTYLAVLLLINAIFSALIAAVGFNSMQMFAGMTWGVAVPVMVFFMVLVGGFIFTLILGAWVHLWVYLFGGRNGIMQTLKAIIYGKTPHLLLGWIPFIGFIFTLWSIVLGILGIRELQELSTGKSIFAVIIAIIIPLVLLIILAAYFMIAYVTTSAMPGVPPTNLL